MSKISSMMDVGKRSLQNSQTALQTVSHNIANKSTEGYSRQNVSLVANNPISEGNLQIGTGARAAMVTRTNNPWIEKQIQREGASLGYAEGRADSLGRVEQVYNEQMNKGLNQYVTDFFNAFREVSNNPESSTSRTLVRESGNALAQDFKRVTEQLRNVQKDIDGQVITGIEEVNQMTKEIATLNEKIQIVENHGVHANDERDRRELLLKKLGERLDITWGEGKDGMVSVTGGNTAVLVSGSSSTELKVRGDAARDRAEIYYRANDSGTLFNITDQFKGGKLGGVLNVRDKVVEDYLAGIDQMAYQLSMEVNKIHIEGYDRYGKNGILFFEGADQVEGAAANLAVNSSILNDVGRIAAGNKQNAPGDNTIANMISSLQFRGIMNDGKDSFDDYYNSIVGEVGTVTQRASKTFEAQKNIMAQLTNIRESISGVSLDEETTKMIEMQKAYEASARMIRVADEMLETVLSLKRM